MVLQGDGRDRTRGTPMMFVVGRYSTNRATGVVVAAEMMKVDAVGEGDMEVVIPQEVDSQLC